MSSLDEELARAAEAPEDAVPARPADDAAAARVAAPRAKRSLGLLIALLVMGGGILLLVFTSFEGSAIYSKGVDELLVQREKLHGRSVRVEGTLVKGSLSRRDTPCEYRFKMQKNGAVLPVQFAQCVVPDTFRDVPGMDVAVTAEGKLGDDGSFEASTILAKCPSKYEMKDRAAKGESMPHGSVVPAAAGAEQKAN